MDDVSGDVEYQQFGITGAYNLGGGLTLSASAWAYELEYDEDSSLDTDGTVVAIALGAKF